MINSKNLGVLIGLSVLCSIVAQGRSLKNCTLDNKRPPYSLRDLGFPNNKDTSIFNTTTSSAIKVFNFDDNNTLDITSKQIKLIAKEESEDSYTLLVKIKGKLILSKKHIKGVSKVFLDNDYLAFSIFTYTDEDGNNQGNGYILNLNDNSVKSFSRQLENTCNPVIINNYVYFIDGLNLIKTDLSFKSQRNSKIIYLGQRKKKNFAYLDTYMICSLSKQDNTKLVIDFAPNKSTGKCKSYRGDVSVSSKVILLKESS